MSPINDDLNILLDILPPHLVAILGLRNTEDLIEVVLDLGRIPLARTLNGDYQPHEDYYTTIADIKHITTALGSFASDNRAGLESTLHRISCMRDRDDTIIGLTIRVGRAIEGTVDIIEDLLETGKSLLFLGKPGSGKTTLIRESARVLADAFGKRVVIVDSASEIAGLGAVPHRGIGRARRMHVPNPSKQPAVMLEATCNHYPEVLLVDEIGDDKEAAACKTIAERGVMLIASAHGITLDNLAKNPVLSKILGGVTTVTISDERAERLGTSKSIREREAPATFPIIVQVYDYNTLVVHHDADAAVDALLNGHQLQAEERTRNSDGTITKKVIYLGEIERPTLVEPMLSMHDFYPESAYPSGRGKYTTKAPKNGQLSRASKDKRVIKKAW